MNWTLPDDQSASVITAERHVTSGHGRGQPPTLPETCVIFEIGMALGCIEECFETVTLAEKLPCFLDNPRCIAIKGHPGVCFTRGGYGAPAAVDTLETVRALGVRRVLIAGMCGGFSGEIRVGDVVIPPRVLSEEGTSRHYFAQVDFAEPDRALMERACGCFGEHFSVVTEATVTSDGVYRQTMAKEALWREQGCVGVDMETSALLSVCRYYSIPAAALLLCSDKHPVSGQDAPWDWGGVDFNAIRREFVRRTAQFALDLPAVGEI